MNIQKAVAFLCTDNGLYSFTTYFYYMHDITICGCVIKIQPIHLLVLHSYLLHILIFV